VAFGTGASHQKDTALLSSSPVLPRIGFVRKDLRMQATVVDKVKNQAVIKVVIDVGELIHL
jgi:hypothetical protein